MYNFYKYRLSLLSVLHLNINACPFAILLIEQKLLLIFLTTRELWAAITPLMTRYFYYNYKSLTINLMDKVRFPNQYSRQSKLNYISVENIKILISSLLDFVRGGPW